MKAVLLHEHGPAENLRLVEDYPLPEPGPGQVRVRLQAVALNRVDWWMREGIPGFSLNFPHILGADAAGTIDKLGEGTEGWQVGDRVALDPGEVRCAGCDYCLRGLENMCRGYNIIGEHIFGTYCEYRVYPVRNLLALPLEISFAEAAAASLVYLTAWHSMITRGGVKPGEHVLIVGASGGVNTACLQIARLLGCITYVVGSDSVKCSMAEELGADYVVDRSRDPDWSKAVFKASQKRGMDVVVDNVGAPTMMQSIRAARARGPGADGREHGGRTFELDNRMLFFRHVSIIGSTMGPHADYLDVMQLVFDGKLNAVIGATYGLEEIVEAHRALESGGVFGKIVLELT
ncbi:MAG: alcohol dehydrogenase catalytic domain-containing protein [Anaerolineae bacterium]|nr:alcohol dehydrogenase catalytic domain-containing protein [Anaerolineae bacterium]